MQILTKLTKWYPIVFGIVVLELGISHSIDFVHLVFLAAVLCGISFALIALHVKPALADDRARFYLERVKNEDTRRDKKIKDLQAKIKLVDENKEPTIAVDNLKIETQIEKLKRDKLQRDKLQRDKDIASIKKEIKSSDVVELSNEVAALKRQMEDIKATSPAEDKDEESPAVILGSSGVYGIVSGIGITDALGNYTKCLTSKVTNSLAECGYVSKVPLLYGILSFDFPYTFRLIGFLVTILPFIHGAILTFSNRWYYDRVEKEAHYGLALIFFTVVFFHAIIFLFVALNLENIEFFILMLCILMGVNAPWIAIQLGLTRKYLKRYDIFLNEWIILNFNTFSFLSVFVFANSELNKGSLNIGNDIWLNILILLVLFFRTVSDYYVGWKDLYNRSPTEVAP